MPETEIGATVTPGPERLVKFANPGQTGALFPTLQSRCSIQKGLLTKALTAAKNSKDEFIQAIRGDASALTTRRKAETLVDRVSNVSSRKNQLEDSFDKLIQHCYELTEADFDPETPPQKMAEYLNKQMVSLIEAADQTMIEHEEFVREAEAHLSTITAPQTKPSAQQQATSQAPQPAPKATMSIFRPNQDLKPAILEKECTYSECLHFIELWKNYMIAGYGSEDLIPQETLAIQLQPFINPTWWLQMTEMGIRQKSFKEIPDTIKEVAGRFITVFDRRLDFLKTKKGSQCHSEFLQVLENKIDTTNFNDWSRDQMVATLFLTYADIEMAKVVTALMNKDSGLNMVELRAQIRALESSTWYKGAARGTDSAKLATGASGSTPPNRGKMVRGLPKIFPQHS